MPPAVALVGAKGASQKASRSDHTHTARVQRKIVNLDASGQASWTFDRMLDNKPAMGYMVFQAASARRTFRLYRRLALARFFPA